MSLALIIPKQFLLTQPRPDPSQTVPDCLAIYLECIHIISFGSRENFLKVILAELEADGVFLQSVAPISQVERVVRRTRTRTPAPLLQKLGFLSVHPFDNHLLDICGDGRTGSATWPRIPTGCRRIHPCNHANTGRSRRCCHFRSRS